MGPLGPDSGPLGPRVIRRARGVAIEAAAFVAVTLTFPVLLLCAAVADLAGRGTDVVFCAHVGLDGFERISDIWRGALVGGTVRVQFWRWSAGEVPVERDALIAWLYERWQQADDWIGTHR